MSHDWTDYGATGTGHPTGKFLLSGDGRLSLTQGGNIVDCGTLLGSVTREILRLTQREADLDALCAQRGEKLARAARRIADLEAVVRERGQGSPVPEEIDREAFNALDPDVRFTVYVEAASWALVARDWERERDEARERVAELEATLVELEKALALAKETAAEWERKARFHEAQAKTAEHGRMVTLEKLHGTQDALSDERSRGQQYALEVAEKVEEIRTLKELGAARLDSINSWHRHAVATGGENRLLRDAIEDGIAHVERARAFVLDCARIKEQPRQPLDSLIDALDLAHEVLSKAAQRDGKASAIPVAVDPARPGADRTASVNIRTVEERAWRALVDRLTDAEESIGKLGAAANPVGHPPTRVRLDSLEGSAEGLNLRVTDLHRRVSAIERSLAPCPEDLDMEGKG